MFEIRPAIATDPALGLVHSRHHAAMHAQTPPESIHMLPPDALAAPGIRFFAMYEGEDPVGMGAFKHLDPHHAEIKSMHVLEEYRGKGLSRQMLAHLITEAKALGYTRLSLETGAEPIFEPARQLYETAGFALCGPFASYKLDPNSVFMTCEI